MTVSALAAAAVGAVVLAAPEAAAQTFVNADTPPPECVMALPDVQLPATYQEQGDRLWPGYLAQWETGEMCIPFMPTENLIPADYSGSDYYVEEFTDSRLREKWQECQLDPECGEPTLELARQFTRFEKRRTGSIDSFGAIDEEGAVDLADIRRPGYFGKAELEHPIAAAEPDTFTVEFTVPRDGFEREHLGLTDTIKLRGWYIQGAGIQDAEGQTVRAMMVINNGGGAEFTAIAHRNHELDTTTGEYVLRRHDLKNEGGGSHNWMLHVHDFYAAGFDVLIVDRRGNGISGGRAGFNTSEQANDIFRMLEQLDSGEGLRILTPAGDTLEGTAAARLPTGGTSPYDLPTVLYGYSRGSFTVQWFMHKNFVENCEYGTREPICEPAVGLENVKGAIIGGANAGGVGYRIAGNDLREAAERVELNTTQLPDGDLIRNLDKWPGLQIISGTFDRVEGLEGRLDAYRRVTGLKDISVFPGQHGTNRYSPEMLAWIAQRMIAFATAAVLGHDKVEGSFEPADLRDLVLSSPQFWEMGMSREGWKPL